MAPNPDEREPLESKRPVPDFQQAHSDLSNPELLSALDLTLLELERRLYRYAHEGEEIMDMADEGLLLASRARARLEQALSGPSTPRAICKWWGWEIGISAAPTPPGTPNRRSPKRIRSLPSPSPDRAVRR